MEPEKTQNALTPSKPKVSKPKLAVVLAVIILVVVVVLENIKPVPVQALFFDGEVSLSLIVTIAAGIGFFMGRFTKTFRRSK